MVDQPLMRKNNHCSLSSFMNFRDTRLLTSSLLVRSTKGSSLRQLLASSASVLANVKVWNVCPLKSIISPSK